MFHMNNLWFITYVVRQGTRLFYGGIFIHNMFDSSTCYGPTGPYVRRLFHNHLTYGRTKQHTIFTYQTSNTQFIDAPEDGPVGPKHVELLNIL